MLLRLRQWRALFSIYIQENLAYKAAGVIWILTDGTTAITMPLVWSAAAAGGMIQGFDSQAFVLYYLMMLIVTGFVTSHFMWDMSWEIKEGVLNTYLVRPISFFQFMLVRNLAWRVVRTSLTAPFLVILLLAYGSMIRAPNLYLGWEFWVAVALGHLVSVTFVMALGTIALYVQEARSIFELYYFPMLFLSGQMFPIALLPDWARGFAMIFPFYYTTAVPVEIVIGRISPADAPPLLAIQVAWIAGSYCLFRVLWFFGLRQYSGVGM